MDSSTPVAEPPVQPAPVMDVVPPSPPAEPEEAPPKPEPAKVEEKPKKQAPPKVDKQPGQGVGLAIFATVMIVLALSAMATYAYLKTK